MSEHASVTSDRGIGGLFGWVLGGTVGGIVGAAVFGLLMWLMDPEIVAAAIPSLYGIDPRGPAGWAIHLAHGAILGLVFGFLLTRPLIMGVLSADVETDVIAGMGMVVRTALAGLAFGLAVWAVLPLLVLPIWTELIGAAEAAMFPAAAVESLLGHALFGIVLGTVFGVVVSEPVDEVETPFEDRSSESISEP